MQIISNFFWTPAVVEHRRFTPSMYVKIWAICRELSFVFCWSHVCCFDRSYFRSHIHIFTRAHTGVSRSLFFFLLFFTITTMRRRAGAGRLMKQREQNERYKEKADELAAQQLQLLTKQLDSFHSHLEEFAAKHKQVGEVFTFFCC